MKPPQSLSHYSQEEDKITFYLAHDGSEFQITHLHNQAICGSITVKWEYCRTMAGRKALNESLKVACDFGKIDYDQESLVTAVKMGLQASHTRAKILVQNKMISVFGSMYKIHFHHIGLPPAPPPPPPEPTLTRRQFFTRLFSFK